MRAAATQVAMLATGAIAGLSACAPAADGVSRAAFHPDYLGIKVAPLDAALFRFGVSMKGARTSADIESYAQCAAAGYALQNGFGFARHVQTDINERGGIWRADAVYTISPALPRGVKTIDAEVTVADCAEQGIPTV